MKPINGYGDIILVFSNRRNHFKQNLLKSVKIFAISRSASKDYSGRFKKI